MTVQLELDFCSQVGERPEEVGKAVGVQLGVVRKSLSFLDGGSSVPNELLLL